MEQSIAFRLIALLVCFATASHNIVAQEAAQPKSLVRIGAGTVVGDASAARWNHVVLVAQPRIATGDVDSLGESIRTAATKFALTIMATIKPYQSADGKKEFRLDEVGVGHSADLSGTRTIISSATVKKYGVDPGFIGRQVLSENEAKLQEAKIVVHSSTLLIFDAPGIMHRKKQHRKYTLRHLIWVDPASGKGATVVWLLGKDSAGKLRPVNEPLRLLAANTVEDRKIHVDGSQFFLGVPSETAFGLDDLPPGDQIAWTSDLARTAHLTSYDQNSLTQLVTALKGAMETGLTKSK